MTGGPAGVCVRVGAGSYVLVDDAGARAWWIRSYREDGTLTARGRPITGMRWAATRIPLDPGEHVPLIVRDGRIHAVDVAAVAAWVDDGQGPASSSTVWGFWSLRAAPCGCA